MAQGPSDTILVAIRITLRIWESKVRNPDPPDRRRFVLSEHIFLVLLFLRMRVYVIEVCMGMGINAMGRELSFSQSHSHSHHFMSISQSLCM